jgi:hypothetical protein
MNEKKTKKQEKGKHTSQHRHEDWVVGGSLSSSLLLSGRGLEPLPPRPTAAAAAGSKAFALVPPIIPPFVQSNRASSEDFLVQL